MTESPEFWEFALGAVTLATLVIKHLLDVKGRKKIKDDLDTNTKVTQEVKSQTEDVKRDAQRAYREANDVNEKLRDLANRPVIIQFEGAEGLEEMLARCLSQVRETRRRNEAETRGEHGRQS